MKKSRSRVARHLKFYIRSAAQQGTLRSGDRHRTTVESIDPSPSIPLYVHEASDFRSRQSIVRKAAYILTMGWNEDSERGSEDETVGRRKKDFPFCFSQQRIVAAYSRESLSSARFFLLSCLLSLLGRISFLPFTVPRRARQPVDFLSCYLNSKSAHSFCSVSCYRVVYGCHSIDKTTIRVDGGPTQDRVRTSRKGRPWVRRECVGEISLSACGLGRTW